MITLEKITWDNFRAVIGLKVTKEQDEFIATNTFSLAQSYVALLNDDDPPMSFAICHDGDIIGFVMMFHDTAEDSNFGEESYGVCRFMIDRDFQGKGYGKEAFSKALDFIKTFPQGKAEAVYLSYEPGNEVARRLYASFGFMETGDIVGGEIVARLPLT